MRNFIFPLMILFISSPAFTQLDDYDVSTYLYPDLSRTTFTLTPDLYYANNKDLLNGKTENFSVKGWAARSHFANSRKKQIFNYVSASLGQTNHTREEEKNKNFQANYFLQVENRYFRSERKYFELALSSQTRFNRNKILEETYDDITSRHQFSPKIGWGRIENISDGWHAWSILKALEQNGYVSKELTHEQIDLFAYELSRIKNLRNRDFRLENIMEFESLVKFAIENGIIDKNEYGSFAILKDAYEFENFVNRNNGQTFDVGVDIDFYRLKNLIAETEYLGYNNYAIVSTYENRKVIKNIFQLDQVHTVKGGISDSKAFNQSEFTRFPFLDLQSQITFGYYLNQRTNLNVGPYAFYRNYLDSDGQIFSSGISLNAKYYASPRLRYQVSGRLSLYNFNDGALLVNDQYYSNISLGLDYFIQ